MNDSLGDDDSVALYFQDVLKTGEQSEYDKRHNLMEAALFQLCINSGGYLSFPMDRIALDAYSLEWNLECRCTNDRFEFRLVKK